MFFPRPMDDLTAGLIQKNEEQEKKDLRTKENKKEQFLMQHFSLKESTLEVEIRLNENCCHMSFHTKKVKVLTTFLV